MPASYGRSISTQPSRERMIRIVDIRQGRRTGQETPMTRAVWMVALIAVVSLASSPAWACHDRKHGAHHTASNATGTPPRARQTASAPIQAHVITVNHGVQ